MQAGTQRRNTKRLKGPERRQQIAEAMLALADTYGIHGVTTAKIAKQVGVSESALYMHFDSRDMMLREAIDVMYEQELATMSNTSGAEDVIEHFLRLSSLFTTGTDLGRTLRIKLQLLAAPLSSELRERILLGEVKRIDAHITLIEKGKNEGSIRADVDSRHLVWDLYDAYSTESIPAAMIGLRRELQSERDDQLVRLLRTVATEPTKIERYLDRLERERLVR